MLLTLFLCMLSINILVNMLIGKTVYRNNEYPVLIFMGSRF